MVLYGFALRTRFWRSTPKWSYLKIFSNKMRTPASTTHKKNPMQDLYNIVPLLTNCDASLSTTGGSSCKCTDPSFGYTKPCKLTSSSNTSTINDEYRSKCYYAPSSNPGNIQNSVGGGLAQKANKRFTVITNAGRQPFTQEGNVTQLIQGANAARTYPTSLLFCSAPEEDATSALPTNATPNLGFSNSTFSNWNATQTGNTTGNLGFA